MAKFPCRCNKKDCRRRKTLPKHPGEYDTPKFCECGGEFKLDKFRTSTKGNKEKQAKDRGAVCNCDGRPLVHRRGQQGCNEREEFMLESAAKGTGAGRVPYEHDDDSPPF